MKWIKRTLLLLVILFAGPILVVACGTVKLGQNWQTADRSPTGIAPDPTTTQEAVVQVYSARAFSWRGIFGVHTWIATKPAKASAFTVHQVLGWRSWRNMSVVDSHIDAPDRAWYGSPPEILADLRGEPAERAILQIEQAVKTYPFEYNYTIWPGPNSNTFTAYIAQQTTDLRVDLPPTAIGKDYPTNGNVLASTPSGTGYQLSLAGVAGVMLAVEEGLEINVLGLTFGLDPLAPAIKLPGLGRLGKP